MPWCVRSLKVVGEGLVEVSSVCSHEWDEGHFEDFVVVDSDRQEIIQVLIFSKHLFEMKFFGEEIDPYTMHFVKITHGRIDWIQEHDYQVIAEEYRKRTGQTFKVIEAYR